MKTEKKHKELHKLQTRQAVIYDTMFSPRRSAARDIEANRKKKTARGKTSTTNGDLQPTDKRSIRSRSLPGNNAQLQCYYGTVSPGLKCQGADQSKTGLII